MSVVWTLEAPKPGSKIRHFHLTYYTIRFHRMRFAVYFDLELTKSFPLYTGQAVYDALAIEVVGGTLSCVLS